MRTQTFRAEKVQDGSHIEVLIPIEDKIIIVVIARGDIGLSVDMVGAKGETVEMGWVSDDDLDLIDDED